ncbi:hypothetical protein chiPu_0030805, partial [Chiloscyllium punctatum]|nr:hypothetical protein [Chiloscyllium punctatum]
DPRVHQLQLRRIERVLHRKPGREDRQQEERERDRGSDHRQFGAAERIENVAVERALEPAGSRLVVLRAIGDDGV